MIAIFNATPMIAFLFDIGDSRPLRLLLEIGYELRVPNYVRASEVLKGGAPKALDELVEANIFGEMTDADGGLLKAFMERHPQLGRGESEVILAARSIAESGVPVVCVIDERAGHDVAIDYGLLVIGTIGLLAKLAEQGQLSHAEHKALLARLYGSNFWIGRK